MTKRKIVTISSTARDLPKHRDAIRLGCERAGFEPKLMEHLPALDADAITASLRMVDDADVYVGVFAFRYGTIPDGRDISITEMEYNRAVERGIPRLIFLMHEDHEITRKDIDSGPLEEKVNILRARLGKERVASFFKSPDELRAQVVESLSALEKEWASTKTEDQVVASVAASLHRKSAIPAAPEAYVAHPYTLLQTRELVGRQAELNALTDWVTKPSSPLYDARIFAITAIGGMGKSALAWKWFRDIAPNEMKPLAGRLWWSFYESDATLENFLIRALSYVSGESEDEIRKRPWRDREDLLFQHLNGKPFLLVLDGLERIMVAYTSMNVNALSDDELDQKTAHVVASIAGLPSTAAQSLIGQHRLRQTNDPRAGRFLQRLAEVAKSRILVTTRLFPSELQLPTGQPRPRCLAYFLYGLSDSDALGLWRALGVSGSREELLRIFNSVQNHPLLVQALASEIANHKAKPGDFALWRSDHPRFDPASLPLMQSRTHILQFALEGLASKVREALHTIVGFRMPANYDALRALLVGEDKTFTTASRLDHALTELEDRGLIGWDRDANRYDAHPIVRAVVWDLIDSRDRHLVLNALNAHFEPMKPPSFSDVVSIDDLTPAIERYHTLVGLGLFDEAFGLLAGQLDGALLHRLAAHRRRIELIEMLFSGGDGSPLPAGDRAHSYLLNSLALSLAQTGQPGRSVVLFRRAADIDKKHSDEENVATDLNNLGNVLQYVGKLREANSAILTSLQIGQKNGDMFRQGDSLATLGSLAVDVGDRRSARIALARSDAILDEARHFAAEGNTAAIQSTLAAAMQDWAKAESLLNWAESLATANKVERILNWISVLRGKHAIERGELSTADDTLHDALSRARSVNFVDFELSALNLLAEVRFRRNQSSEAKVILEQLWEPADCGPYRLILSDSHCLLAKIERALGNDAAARVAARKAYEEAWCDGPPYAYAEGLKNARAMLDALKEPYPDMPLFDESKFEPLPDVDINPKDEYWVDPDNLDRYDEL